MSSVYEEFVIKNYVASRNATQWQIHRKRVLHKVVWITQSIVSTIATKHLYVLQAVMRWNRLMDVVTTFFDQTKQSDSSKTMDYYWSPELILTIAFLISSLKAGASE